MEELITFYLGGRQSPQLRYLMGAFPTGPFAGQIQSLSSTSRLMGSSSEISFSAASRRSLCGV